MRSTDTQERLVIYMKKKVIIFAVLFTVISSVFLIFLTQSNSIPHEIHNALREKGYETTLEFQNQEGELLLSQYKYQQTATIQSSNIDIRISLCKDEETALNYSEDINSDSFATVDFADIPHFFQHENAIILYTGYDTEVLKSLIEVCGEEFYPSTSYTELDWGLEFIAENAKPTGITLSYTQKDGEQNGTLYSSPAYFIEVYDNGCWTEISPITPLITTLVANPIQTNSTQKGELVWEPWYGELSSGRYRIGFEVTNSPSNETTQVYYASFFIE